MKTFYKIICIFEKILLDSLNYKAEIISRFIIGIVIFLFLVVFHMFKNSFKFIPEISTNYFYFLLTGIISSAYFARSLSFVNKNLKRILNSRILDFILATPTNPLVILLAVFIFNFFYVFIIVLPILIFAIFILHISLNLLDIIFLCIIFFISLGISFAVSIFIFGLIIIFKSADDFIFLFINSQCLLSGIYMPINFLPLWMQKLSKLLPLTYTVRSMRAIFLHNYSLYFILKDIFILTIFFLIFLFFGIWFWNFAIKRAKIKGDFYY